MSRVQILTKTHFWWFYGWNFNASVKSKMDQCVEWFLTFCFTLGRKKICTCFNFNGGSFIYLKLRDFDVGLHLEVFWSSWYQASSRAHALTRSSYWFESGSCPKSVKLLIWVGRTNIVKLQVTEVVRVGAIGNSRAFLAKDTMVRIAHALHCLWARFPHKGNLFMISDYGLI